MIVRPVRSADLPALMELALSTGAGLTTLPANEARLAHRVGWAEKAFSGEAGRADADYLFVMEDDDGKVVGISAIAGAVGKREPWYNYRVTDISSPAIIASSSVLYIASTGHSGTHAPHLIHSSGLIYNCFPCFSSSVRLKASVALSSVFIGPCIQSTGQTLTQLASIQLTQGFPII